VLTAGLCLFGAAEAGARTFVSEKVGSPGPRERPATITQGADAVYANLGWISWGGRTAHATGTFQGLATEIPVHVTLSRPRRCGRHRLYTRAVAEPETGGRLVIENVGCRIALLESEEGQEEPDLTALVRPDTIPRAPGAPLTDLRWKRWSKPVARARGRTVEGGRSVPVRIVASRAGWCPAVGSLAYRRLRVTVGGSAFTLRFGSRC
jgi:hypothetical protein